MELLSKLKDPLILVIDMQNVYSVGQKWECFNFNQVLGRIKQLIEHRTNEQIVFTRYIASKNPHGMWKKYNKVNSDVNSDEWSNELVNYLKSLCREYKCCDKSVYSAFSIDYVREAAIKASCVIVTGVVAECCVLSTVMSLIDAGVYVIYLKDAVAGINEDTASATLKVLEGLVPLHLCIMTTDEYIKLTKGK